MVARARTNAAKLGYDNVEFRLGEIESLPVRDGTVDVVISNCVLNVVPDKAQAFAELLRVLKPGGHFCVSDVIATGTLPQGIRKAASPSASPSPCPTKSSASTSRRPSSASFGRAGSACSA